MFIKPGVSISKLQACMIPAIIVCIDFFASIKKDFVITSGNDSKHMAHSLHYTGLAFDVRSRDMTESECFDFRIYFTQRLDNIYYFLVESTHIHIQYDESISETPWP